MYDPLGGSDFEFIELENIGSKPINLAGARFTKGIRFDFPNIIIQPGEFIILVQNLDQFQARYGNELNVAGE